MQNNNNYGLHENILLMLEVKAKQTGKSLEEVIEEYKKTLEEGKKQAQKENERIAKFKDIVQKMVELSGKTENEIIKTVFTNAGLKIPNYQHIKAHYDYKDIKEDDTLIFDMDYTELKDGKIYLIEYKIGNREVLLYAEYNKELDSFILDTGKEKILKRDDRYIKILGIITKIQREDIL